MTFNDMPLLETLQRTLAEKGFTVPTEIQVRVMPVLLAGKSLVGLSATGSGKTLSYVVPVLDRLKRLEDAGDATSNRGRPRAVVMVPSRDLGEQVTRVFKEYTHTTRLRVRSVLGGTKLEIARTNATGAFEVLVATPGRLVKLLDEGLVSFGDLRILILDEADQMLDEGFLPTAKRLLAACPPKVQRALFSSTAPRALQSLLTQQFSDLEVMRTGGNHQVVPTLVTSNRAIVGGDRGKELDRVLAERHTGSTLIFTNTRAQCDAVAAELALRGAPCVVYRGEMDKKERRANLQAFRDGEVRFLISTDLASRGLDIEHVDRVINYHLPSQLENYLHRVGRTARAGRAGLVVNFVTDRDQTLIMALSRGAGAGGKMADMPAPPWAGKKAGTKPPNEAVGSPSRGRAAPEPRAVSKTDGASAKPARTRKPAPPPRRGKAAAPAGRNKLTQIRSAGGARGKPAPKSPSGRGGRRRP